MNELLTDMKKYADECKEQVKDPDFEQIKAFEERFNLVVIKELRKIHLL
jgi:hypothetical protein